jgi:hypothetical protein
VFYTLLEAQVIIEAWRCHYHTIWPHSALGYRPPASETVRPRRPIWPALSIGSGQIGGDQRSPPH